MTYQAAHIPLKHCLLSSVIGHQSSNSWTYSYLPNSDLIAEVSNTVAGVISMRSYEANRNLVTEIHNQAQGSTISRFQYENDEIGRRTLRIDNTATTNLFSYNARSELTGAIMSTNTFSYAFDPIGNRLSASNNVDEWTYLCNALNQYTNITDGVTISPTYDDDGNMATYNGWTYTWNGENRMVGASNGSTVVSYQYDYMGRRYQKVVNGITNNFIYDGWAMIQETSSSGTTNSYVYGLDLSGSLQGAGTIGGILSASFNGTNAYFCYDANGNVADLVETNGNSLAHYEFDPFGNTVLKTGAVADANPYRFSTKYQDVETGFYYYGYRYLTSGLGRWLSRDPIGERGGLNSHGFVNNQVVGKIDYLGMLFQFQPCGGKNVRKRVWEKGGLYLGYFHQTTCWEFVDVRYYDWRIPDFPTGDPSSPGIDISIGFGGAVLRYREITYTDIKDTEYVCDCHPWVPWAYWSKTGCTRTMHWTSEFLWPINEHRLFIPMLTAGGGGGSGYIDPGDLGRSMLEMQVAIVLGLKKCPTLNEFIYSGDCSGSDIPKDALFDDTVFTERPWSHRRHSW